jgi:hypothetical protein
MRRLRAPALGLLTLLAAPLSAQSYHLTHSYVLGGPGGWDYLTLDARSGRLFIGRSDRIMVVDAGTGALVGEIPGLSQAHGVAIAPNGHGFATSGGDATVVMFDARTLRVLGRATSAPGADAILYEPSTDRIFAFNASAHSATAFDPATGRSLGTVALAGQPEFAVATGDGRLYVNLEDLATVAELDPARLTVRRSWSLAPCTAPTGLAIDDAHHRLFSGCRNQLMAISNAETGRLSTTLPIGAGVDGCRFDPVAGLAFASNGDGTITAIRELTPDSFAVVATIPTRRGARTLELDPSTHRLFTVSAEFGPTPPPTPEQPRPRPPIRAGSFTLMVFEP